MAHKYAEIAFTEQVKQVQREQSSRDNYAFMEGGEDFNHLLSHVEADFIGQRDSFYMGSVSESGWPYVQHRGGPKGFMRVIDEKTLGFADFSGNRQYISTGNFRTNNRIALFFMDYPNRTRLKMFGRISKVNEDDWETLAKLEDENYRATVERGFLIHIEAFDWNCPQHIVPRYTEEHLESLLAPLQEENRLLKESGNLPALNELGTGPLKLVVSGIRQLTPNIRSYELRSFDKKELPPFTAGAHLQVPVLMGDGTEEKRHYSISSSPLKTDVYEIAVLQEPNGKGGSRFIHEKVSIGQVLNCELPQNYFQMHTDSRPTVLIAGGIGITQLNPWLINLAVSVQTLNCTMLGRIKRIWLT